MSVACGVWFVLARFEAERLCLCVSGIARCMWKVVLRFVWPTWWASTLDAWVSCFWTHKMLVKFSAWVFWAVLRNFEARGMVFCVWNDIMLMKSSAWGLWNSQHEASACLQEFRGCYCCCVFVFLEGQNAVNISVWGFELSWSFLGWSFAVLCFWLEKKRWWNLGAEVSGPLRGVSRQDVCISEILQRQNVCQAASVRFLCCIEEFWSWTHMFLCSGRTKCPRIFHHEASMLLPRVSESVAGIPAFSNDNVQRIFQHEVTVLSKDIVKVWFVLMSSETACMHVFLC